MGYQLPSSYKKDFKSEYAIDAGGTLLQEVSHLFGFRMNMTPIMYETKALQKKTATDSSANGKLTLGSPIWLQTFVAGNIYKDISFFGEFEFANGGAFKFNWFYFNFTNLLGTNWLNFQVGNISPQEFTSYPDRLPQLPMLKGEVFKIKSSTAPGSSKDGGDNSVDMTSARPGITYFGYTDFLTIYAGVSPGKSVSQVSDALNMHGGIVLHLPESISESFAGSTLTFHYLGGKDTKGYSTAKSFENKYSRISPQLNIRWNGKLDLQAAYVIANNDNWFLDTTGTSLSYNGMAIDIGYLFNENWHAGVHFDNYASEEINGKKLFEFQRLVPAVTYIINQNFRLSLYFELDMTKDKVNKLSGKKDENNQKLYLNLRTMI